MASGAALLRFFFLSFGYVLIQMALAPLRLRLLTTWLDEAAYGIVSLVIQLVTFAVFVGSLGLYEYLLRHLPGATAADQAHLTGKLMRLVLGLTAVIGIALCPLALLYFADSPITRSGVFACLLALCAFAVLQYRIFVLLARSELLKFRACQLLALDLWFFLLIPFLAFRELDIPTILWVWAGWLCLMAIVTDPWTSLAQAFRRLPRLPLKPVLAFSLPLLPMLFGEMLFRLADRIFVGSLLGATVLGEYTAAMNVALLVYMVGTNVLGLLVPTFNELRNRATAQPPWQDPALCEFFTVMIRYALILGLFGGAVLAFLGLPVLVLLVDAKFHDAVHILPWAAPASVCFLLHLCFSRVLIALDRSRLVGFLTLAAALLNLVLNPILIPLFRPHGEIGAALATTISLATLAAASGCALRAHRWIHVPQLRVLRLLLAFAVGTTIFWLSSTHLAQLNSLVLLGLNGLVSLALLAACRLVTPADLALWMRKP